MTFRQLSHFPAFQAELGECWQLDEDIHGGVDVHLLAVGQVEILEHPQLLEAFGQQTGKQLVRFLNVEHTSITEVQVSSGATYSQEGTSASYSSPGRGSGGSPAAQSLRAAAQG